MPDSDNGIDGVQQRLKRSGAKGHKKVSRVRQRNKMVIGNGGDRWNTQSYWNTYRDEEQRLSEPKKLEQSPRNWKDFRYALLVLPKRQRG